MNRLIFLTGLAVGYVLGARAGRQRYEAIAHAARTLADRPEVQGTAGLLQAQAARTARTALDTVLGRSHPAHTNGPTWN